ncbi:MAG: hypothetical protein ACLRHJ_11040 [Faecalimonas umbilicata]|uniref:hypothetical protein n=1 Tax=Faecalimonas umbilicata TaxID=1912855 RepID=UPI0039A36B8F
MRLRKNRETSRREKEEADKKERESDNARAVLESRLIENEKERTALQKEIGEGMKAFPFLLREQIKDSIIEKEKEEDAERESKRTLEQECETIKEQLQSDRLMAKDLEHEAKELHTKEEECQAQLAIYEELTEKSSTENGSIWRERCLPITGVVKGETAGDDHFAP